jgi:hypothetical protein
MFRSWSALVLIAVAALLTAAPACAPKEPPPPAEPPPPPPPTPEEIAQKIVEELGLTAPLPPPGTPLSTQDSQTFKSAVQKARNQNNATPDGKRALQIASNKLDERIAALEENKLWEHTLAGIEGYEVLNPGSPKWSATKELASAELKKPKVTIVGFMTSHDQNSVLLDFYLPIQKTHEKQQVRVGEEFFGLTLVEIIGNNQGVRLEYADTGQVYEVLTKSASSR